jgi:HAD superfamily hydrolase (TIGR01509 family)
MPSLSATAPLTPAEERRAGALSYSRPRRPTVALKGLAPREPDPSLDSAASRWQLAFDAAQQALRAAGGRLPSAELGRRQRGLTHEREETAAMLVQLARETGVRPLPWLSPVPVTASMLGLRPSVRACLFDLDGVLTDSAALHAWAWGEVFDELLMRLSERAGWHYIPFDRDADYHAFIEGRPRLEGVHAFLQSRGIRVPEGRLNDPAQAETALGIARRKGEVLARGLRERGVSALAGARRYLEAAGHAGLARGAVSASTSMSPMLELAGLATLLEDSVDAEVMRAEGLRARPAPDLLLTACDRLGVRPEETVTFTHTGAGIAAGRLAGLEVVGVGAGAEGKLLRSAGGERIVSSLRELLDPQLSRR